MNDQDLEFQITRLIDNDLTGEERAQMEARIASDPEAKRLFDEHQNLNAILQTEAVLPAIHWDRLANAISDHVTGAAEVAREQERPAVLFSFKWLRPTIPALRLALAACVLLAVGVGIWRVSSSNKQVATGPGNVQVAVLITDDKTAGMTQRIEIGEPGPSAAFAAANGDLSIQEAIVAPPTRVAIDSAVLPAQDTDRLPY